MSNLNGNFSLGNEEDVKKKTPKSTNIVVDVPGLNEFKIEDENDEEDEEDAIINPGVNQNNNQNTLVMPVVTNTSNNTSLPISLFPSSSSEVHYIADNNINNRNFSNDNQQGRRNNTSDNLNYLPKLNLLLSQKASLIAEFKKAYPWRPRIFGHHHHDRRNAVCKAILNAHNLETIQAIIDNQIHITELRKVDTGTMSQNLPKHSQNNSPSSSVDNTQTSAGTLADKWSTTSKNRFSENSGYVKAIKALQEKALSYSTNNV